MNLPTAWERRLVGAALALALFVVVASSYLRVAGNGLGCAPWPQCYGTALAAEQANATPVVRALRAGHRVAATTFLLVAVVLVAGAWRRWPARHRATGTALLAVTLLLAAVGLLTPSAVPWITWANVAGGFALVALLLRLPGPLAADGSGSRFAAPLLALIVVQVLAGTLLSARLAGADCAPACSDPGGDVMTLFAPRQVGTAAAVGHDRGAAVALHGLHRIGGLVIALAVLGWAAARALRGNASYGVAAGSGAAVLALGFVAAHATGPGAVAAHAGAAALLCAACALALGARRPD